MTNFNYLRLSKTKKIRFLKLHQKNGIYIVFLHGFMSDLEGKKPKTYLNFAKKNNVLKIGEGDDWLEILGCGMVNPKVLENCNIDSSVYQGFAFGMGIERLSMLKYGITDMRGLFDLNIKWLDHYGFSPLDLKTRSEI